MIRKTLLKIHCNIKSYTIQKKGKNLLEISDFVLQYTAQIVNIFLLKIIKISKYIFHNHVS